MEEVPNKRKNKKIKKQSTNFWPLKIFIMAIALSLGFSILSEYLMGATGIIVAILVIVLFVSIAIITDMIGVAVTACSKEPFMAMCSKKVRGAKEGLMLIRNADKVASLCADVLGDVCGILSGSAGAALLANIALTAGTFKAIFVSSLIAAIIAGFTIGGKAVFKRVAITHATSITLNFAKLINFFTHKG